MSPLFSPMDADLAALKWRDKDGYAVRSKAFPRSKRRATVFAHRLVCERILGRKPDHAKGELCDHINRNKLDNRRENLRIVSHRENAINTSRVNNDPKYAYRQGSRFRAIANFKGKPVHIGIFATAEEAKSATLKYLGLVLAGRYPKKQEGQTV